MRFALFLFGLMLAFAPAPEPAARAGSGLVDLDGSSRNGLSAPTARDLHAALESLLAGKPAKTPSGPAVGCIIEGGE